MRRLLSLGLLVVLFASAAAVAYAQEAQEVVIVDVNLTRYDEQGRVTIVAEFRNIENLDVSKVVVTEEGVVINDVQVSTIEQSTVDVGVVLAIDVSGSMAGAPLEAAKAAAIQFVNQKREQDNIALVTFDSDVNVVVPFTNNARSVTNAISLLEDGSNTAFYDAIVRSASLYRGSGLQPHIIALTDGNDDGSTATLEQAIAAVVDQEIRVFAIAIESPQFTPESLQELAAASPGGAYLSAATLAELDQLYADIRRELNNKLVLQFTANQSQEAPTAFRVEYEGLRDAQTVTVPGFLTSTATPDVTSTPTTLASATPFIVESTTPASIGTLVIVGSVMVGLSVLAVGLVLFGPRGDEQQEKMRLRMRQFERGSGTDPNAGKSFLAKIPFLRRLSEQAEEAAQRRGLFHSINGVLEQANLPLRPGEAIALAFILAIVIGLVAGAVTLNVFVGIGVAVAAILGVFAVINLLGSREKRKFEEQLPDTLTLLSTSLRAGYSLLQAVEAVATEAPQPTGREFGRAIAEIRLGRQVVDALEGVAERTRSGDFTWTVMAVEIQREVGGNLSEVLQTVADTMLQRNRLRREVRALTAEGRISAIVLGSMPFLLFLFLYTSNRNYIEPLFTQTVGRYAIIVGLILMGVGGFWMKKIVDIEI